MRMKCISKMTQSERAKQIRTTRNLNSPDYMLSVLLLDLIWLQTGVSMVYTALLTVAWQDYNDVLTCHIYKTSSFFLN